VVLAELVEQPAKEAKEPVAVLEVVAGKVV
jgi:hypothetical protein